ncbi:uncharacterized protein PGTG_12272 [Puccinia graminis f. sp. tritici CRL 75-36-700-3]|uniref:Uncharacterized protein n=1 Tax=Puccinia graminis f. sp. tritici (strain CRL 75-36-700-3 / race SCCL) TaxID=418459 RepID=E3KPT1_PUCGT|nr:uncharacterized protein PGTG_12272 [Puccinia graminis f. sp. tritici CRL 75-36-700-3]EFP86316.2 hypothetical protein PGTG_12272 [Puccinia graminis f. sp. tritici CRL 75-36-700-3]
MLQLYTSARVADASRIYQAARQLKNHFDATPQRQHMSEVSPAGEAPVRHVRSLRASMKPTDTESEEEYWGSRVNRSSGSALTLSGVCSAQRIFVDEEANCLPLALGLTTESHQAGPRPRGARAKLESCNSGCPIVKKENTSPPAECRRGHRREELS